MITGWRATKQTGPGKREAPTPWSAKPRPSKLGDHDEIVPSPHSGSPRAEKDLQDRDVQVPAPRPRVDLTQHAVPFQHIKLQPFVQHDFPVQVVSVLSPQTLQTWT